MEISKNQKMEKFKKKKKVLPKKNRVSCNIKIIAEETKTILRYADPNEEWDNDDTNIDTYIHGIQKVDANGYSDLTIPFDVEPGRTYYLVYANYDTGDSFGQYGGQVCYIDLFKRYSLAKKLMKLLQEDASIPLDVSNWTNSTNNLSYTREDGSKIDCYTGTWKGYFESLNYFTIESVRIVD